MNSGPCAWVKEFTTWITPQCFWFFIVFFFSDRVSCFFSEQP
jgi:hypothetical protein